MKKNTLRYHGSKWLLARWLIPMMPESEVYVEGFGGSGSVLIQRSRCVLDVYNDLDYEVVTYFKVLRNRTDELLNALYLTPFAYEEFNRSVYEPDLDELEVARRFYVRSFQSIAGPTARWRSYWRRQKMIGEASNGHGRLTPAAVSFARLDKLYYVADRFRGVQIECMEIMDLLDRYDYPNVFWYLDPPYMKDTRKAWAQAAYKHEMSDDQHLDLLNRIKSLEGSVMISGYSSDVYEDHLSDWNRAETKSRINGVETATEVVWMNYDPPPRPAQLSLFD